MPSREKEAAVTVITEGERARRVAIGVDTHKHVHVAVALDELGTFLGDLVIPVDRAGYEHLLAWATDRGKVVAFGIEGTGSGREVKVPRTRRSKRARPRSSR
jgi:transposase